MSKNGTRAYNASRNNVPKESTEEIVKPVDESVEEIKKEVTEETPEPVDESVEETKEEVTEETPEPVDESVEETKEEVVEPVDEFEVVKVSGCQKLRVRKTPTTEANNVVKIIPAGTILRVRKHNADWSEIKDGGFVMSKFIVQV